MPNPDTFSRKILLLLAAMVASTPLAIDMYLPAMLEMAKSMQTTIEVTQLSLSSYLAGYALGMLFFGPLVDQLGRKKLAIAGLFGFMIASLLLANTHNVALFIAIRAIQAFCGAAITVVVPGIIRHLYQDNTAKGMSYVSMIMMLAPLIAPTVGSALMVFWHWHAIFYALAVYAGTLLILVSRYLFEVPLYKSKLKGLSLFFDSYKQVLTNQKARFDILSSMFASFAFFCFLTSVSAIYLDYFAVSEQFFGVLFGFNVCALMLGNFINTRLVPKVGSRKMLSYGLTFGLSCGVCLWLFSYFDFGLYYIAAAIAPLMMSLGIMATNADALILIRFKEKSGTATAVIGTLRFGSGAFAGPILSLIALPGSLGFASAMLLAVLSIAISQFAQSKIDNKKAA